MCSTFTIHGRAVVSDQSICMSSAWTRAALCIATMTAKIRLDLFDIISTCIRHLQRMDEQLSPISPFACHRHRLTPWSSVDWRYTWHCCIFPISSIPQLVPFQPETRAALCIAKMTAKFRLDMFDIISPRIRHVQRTAEQLFPISPFACHRHRLTLWSSVDWRYTWHCCVFPISSIPQRCPFQPGTRAALCIATMTAKIRLDLFDIISTCVRHLQFMDEQLSPISPFACHRHGHGQRCV